MGPLVAALVAGAAQAALTPRQQTPFQPVQFGGGGMRGTQFQAPQNSAFGSSIAGPLMEAFLKQKKKDPKEEPSIDNATPAQQQTIARMVPHFFGW